MAHGGRPGAGCIRCPRRPVAGWHVQCPASSCCCVWWPPVNRAQPRSREGTPRTHATSAPFPLTLLFPSWDGSVPLPEAYLHMQACRATKRLSGMARNLKFGLRICAPVHFKPEIRIPRYCSCIRSARDRRRPGLRGLALALETRGAGEAQFRSALAFSQNHAIGKANVLPLGRPVIGQRPWNPRMTSPREDARTHRILVFLVLPCPWGCLDGWLAGRRAGL